MEAIAESFLVFYVFITLPPEITVLLMCGVFSTHSLFQAVTNVYYYCRRGNEDYSLIGHANLILQYRKRYHCFVNFITICGFFSQILGLLCVMVFLMKACLDVDHNRILGVALLIPFLLILSFSWSNLVQKFTFNPSQISSQQEQENRSHQNNNNEKDIAARWKSSKKCVLIDVCDWYVELLILLSQYFYFYSA